MEERDPDRISTKYPFYPEAEPEFSDEMISSEPQRRRSLKGWESLLVIAVLLALVIGTIVVFGR